MTDSKEFWDTYAEKNESRFNPEFAKFVKDLAISLRCSSVLEIGCGTGIDLKLFPENIDVNGIDLNDKAINMAKLQLPKAKFNKSSITNLPFEDSSIDFVFTHQLLNYLSDDILETGISEMYRVARKYIMNCERYHEFEIQIDKNTKFRNMEKRWLNYKVRIVSNVDMHEEIDPDKSRFTLLRKM
jgi:ubiquinone/menaquinone biosynthesis C-methylase UbiE